MRTYYPRNKEKLRKQYYENNKERLKKQARNRYRELFNEEKNIKKEYRRKRR